jgi:hypothetical protein
VARLTEGEKHFGPITYGRTHGWRPIRLVWSSEGNDDGCYAEHEPNSLTGYAFGWVAKINLPKIIRPFLIKHVPKSWDAATIARLGRNYYYEAFPREYGFCLSEGHFTLFLGAQTHDSTTTQSWSCFLPWTQWRFARFSLFGLDGSEFWTQLERKRIPGLGRNWDEQYKMQELCPTASFLFKDYDGKEITVKTRIQEREWHFGEGWFKWLSWFRKPMVKRSLDLQFSEEVGPEKGSWKGGTMGHSIDMLPGELHEAAFRRYCAQEHRSKHQAFGITFIGAAP